MGLTTWLWPSGTASSDQDTAPSLPASPQLPPEDRQPSDGSGRPPVVSAGPNDSGPPPILAIQSTVSQPTVQPPAPPDAFLVKSASTPVLETLNDHVVPSLRAECSSSVTVDVDPSPESRIDHSDPSSSPRNDQCLPPVVEETIMVTQASQSIPPTEVLQKIPPSEDKQPSSLDQTPPATSPTDPTPAAKGAGWFSYWWTTQEGTDVSSRNPHPASAIATELETPTPSSLPKVTLALENKTTRTESQEFPPAAASNPPSVLEDSGVEATIIPSLPAQESLSPPYISVVPSTSVQDVPSLELPPPQPNTEDHPERGSPTASASSLRQPSDSAQLAAMTTDTATVDRAGRPNPLMSTLPATSSVWQYFFSNPSRLFAPATTHKVTGHPLPKSIAFPETSIPVNDPDKSTQNPETLSVPPSDMETSSTAPVPIGTSLRSSYNQRHTSSSYQRGSVSSNHSLPPSVHLGSTPTSVSVHEEHMSVSTHNGRPTYAASIRSKKSNSSIRSAVLSSLRAVAGGTRSGTASPKDVVTNRREESVSVSRPSTPETPHPENGGEGTVDHGSSALSSFPMELDEREVPLTPSPPSRAVSQRSSSGSFFSLRRKASQSTATITPAKPKRLHVQTPTPTDSPSASGRSSPQVAASPQDNGSSLPGDKTLPRSKLVKQVSETERRSEIKRSKVPSFMGHVQTTAPTNARITEPTLSIQQSAEITRQQSTPWTTPRKSTTSLISNSSATKKARESAALTTVTTTVTNTGGPAVVHDTNYVFPISEHLAQTIQSQRQQWYKLLNPSVPEPLLPTVPNGRDKSHRVSSSGLLGTVIHKLEPYLPAWVTRGKELEDSPDSSARSVPGQGGNRSRQSFDGVSGSNGASPTVSSAGERRYSLNDTATYGATPLWRLGSEDLEALSDNPPMRKVVIIGVHGWFPMKIFSKIIGEPTGTSSKFCEQMYEGLLMYLKQKQLQKERTCRFCGHQADFTMFSTTDGPSFSESLEIDPDYYARSDDEGDEENKSQTGGWTSPNLSESADTLLDQLESVTLIPLSGEGKIEDRVEMLWTQLVESDTATQQQAMRTIPLVRRAWRQDSEGDLMWLPATVRAQIQVQQLSKRTRGVAPGGQQVGLGTQRMASRSEMNFPRPTIPHNTSAGPNGNASPTSLRATKTFPMEAVQSSKTTSVINEPNDGAPREPIDSGSTTPPDAVSSTATIDTASRVRSNNKSSHPPPEGHRRVRKYLCSRCHRSTLVLREGSDPKNVQLSANELLYAHDKPGGSRSPRISVMPWLPALYQADTIFIATHSQGTPVSALLFDRLITEGLVNPNRQRVGMLAMAGISHGPFPHLKDNLVVKYFEAEAARELFTLADGKSAVSRRYQSAISRVLDRGVKVVTVGSMVDQVVPLYSSILHGASHMNLYRAIYIDGAHYGADFLTDLLTFALRLRNHGLFDHDLLVHISDAIAGSLYTGTPGHSTIYNDTQVYITAAQWVMESIPSRQLTKAAAPPGFFQRWATFRNKHLQAASARVARHLPRSLFHSNQEAKSGGNSSIEPSPPSSSTTINSTASGESPDNGDGHSMSTEQQEGHEESSCFRPFSIDARTNPFYLPWILRGLYEDPLIVNHPVFGKEILRLREKFIQWRPTQKNLRELKFRLDPLKSSL
ncbi:hypothetical protein IWQ62_000619 [Dispira parvispora]|uniref:YMC020W-like alpha/beta hydrolase domain-containing protein n=1 Tax=Dispira parvispora TaxID=1520584 RepID=A0A9W8AWP6_9FUNG|nr:hypothetical protein IWQ62_000619 [Dispira parvispora]